MDLEREIARRVWNFGRADGHEFRWLVQLAPGGKIVNHSHPNEAAWAINDGTLVFLNEANEVTTVFDTASQHEGRLRLEGRFFQAGNEYPLHTLTSWRPFDPSLALANAFHARSEHSGGSTLVVTLNGRGRCFDGDWRRTEFEMAGLAPSLGADALLVLEAEQRCAWYADKADAVLEEVRSALRPRHHAVALVGMSAGGYGAVLVAERLAAARPDLTVSSVAINATTSLTRSDQETVWRDVPSRFIPPWISPDALAHCLPRDQDLRVCAQAGLARHFFFFDSGNPAERFYSERMHDNLNCTLIGIELDMAHAEGCAALYRSGEPAALLSKLLASPKPSRRLQSVRPWPRRAPAPWAAATVRQLGGKGRPGGVRP